MSRTILITGASSGLGAALAEAYAGPDVRLHLGGRDGDRLAMVADRCRRQGAEVQPAELAVTDAAAMNDWLDRAAHPDGLDLVIANAGISGGTGGAGGDPTRRIFAVNIDGVVNTVLPAIDIMRRQQGGQIAIMASLAGFRGMPGAPAYSASKAAVRVWGEGLRGWLRADGIRVSVICPGFVRTPMTGVNRFPMPFLMDAGRAARIIVRGLAADRARIAFPWPTALLSWCLAALPPRLTDPFLARLPGKD